MRGPDVFEARTQSIRAADGSGSHLFRWMGGNEETHGSVMRSGRFQQNPADIIDRRLRRLEPDEVTATGE